MFDISGYPKFDIFIYRNFRYNIPHKYRYKNGSCAHVRRLGRTTQWLFSMTISSVDEVKIDHLWPMSALLRPGFRKSFGRRRGGC